MGSHKATNIELTIQSKPFQLFKIVIGWIAPNMCGALETPFVIILSNSLQYRQSWTR